MIIWNKRAALCRTFALTALVLSSGFFHPSWAQDDESKAENTPCLWQKDPAGGFEGDGSNYCAPSSLADGLVYLAKSRGLDDIVESTDHDGQIAVIKELAQAMGTDPAAGTGPAQILTGLQKYVKERGYSLEHLQVATWRPLGQENNKFSVATAPDLDWLAEAADDPDTVVICNFGWYRKEADGTYKRLGGHWVNLVGAGEHDGEFEVHNPALNPTRQKTESSITLTELGDAFVASGVNSKNGSMEGYYQVEGPGVGLGTSTVTAVLDGAVAFKVATD